MKEKSWFPVVYMFVVTAVFSSVVIGLTGFTGERVAANKRLGLERAVLEALRIASPAGASGIEIHKIFLEKIVEPDTGQAGAYRLVEQGRQKGLAIPLSGQGFWAPMKGFIGLENDERTIRGISFYEQNETPGLGAQIMTAGFRDQFVKKRLGEAAAIRIRPITAELSENEVHAVTGATQTSGRLEKLINDSIRKWRDLGEFE
ncbi:MAG: FMN-binding protein [Planctomycetota bacterium]